MSQVKTLSTLKNCLLITVCLIFSTQSSFISADKFYVLPSPTTPCPMGSEILIIRLPCFTLSQYATDSSHFGTSTNIELTFLPGHHNLTSSFIYRDRTNVQITMSVSDSSAETQVTCSDQANFTFEAISRVSVSGIRFNDCSGNITSVPQFSINGCTFVGQNSTQGVLQATGLSLKSVTSATMSGCVFSSNKGREVEDPFSTIPISAGGAMVIVDSTISISTSTFDDNTANQGGAIFSLRSDISINQCLFTNNVADSLLGGGIYGAYVTLNIIDSHFTNNSANGDEGYGGALEVLSATGTTIISGCVFFGNTANFSGGAVNVFSEYFGINISDTQFIQNQAKDGAALYIDSVYMMGNSLTLTNNVANSSVMHIFRSIVIIGGNTTISDNIGSVFSLASIVNFTGHTFFLNNFHPTTSVLQEGGALASFQCEIAFINKTVFMYNRAKFGGAIAAKESKVYMYGSVQVSQNNASESGGGVFLYQSELDFNSTAEIFNNSAAKNGGGFYSISSMTNIIDGSVQIAKNTAGKNGGAMYLELNAKLYVIKHRSECPEQPKCGNRDNNTWIRLEIADNTAYEYGGALYVDDDTNVNTCESIPYRAHFTAAECFFQVLAFHRTTEPNLNLVNTFFINNSANIEGDTIYGGLLDRCRVSSFAEIFHLTNYNDLTPVNIDAISYLLNVTNIQRKDLQSQVKSKPVRICFCNENNIPDCSFQPPTIYTIRGAKTVIPLVIVDQVNNTIPNGLVFAFLTDFLGLERDQSGQNTSMTGMCSNLQYNIHSSQKEADILSFIPDGPCDNIGISLATINITLLPCPAGFNDSGTDCICDNTLKNYITDCSADTGSVTRVGNIWLSVINSTAKERQYLTYESCPLDYCRPSNEKVSFNLSAEHGSDALCAFDRTGVLCGACDRSKNLSHVFGSSRCRSCSNDWLALIIPFILAGIALVGFILLFNLTVAVGSIDALIFYANIVGPNRDLLLFEKSNFFSIFIAWLNLDFGFETCFFDGLDEYAKVWLQFVFPTYIIFLVAMVIVISKYSNSFATLLSKRNPIATLATLILLSFTKLVRAAIAALSFARVDVQVNGTIEEVKIVWQVDGNVPYLKGKHIPLFLVAFIASIFLLAYILLLLFWQWLLRCPDRKPFRWIRDVRLNSFMDAYNAPFTKRHRYWTGLLLIVRSILYIINSLNIFDGPKSPFKLFAIVVVVGSLFALKEIIKRRIYKERFLNILEGCFLYNLQIFAAASLYLVGNSEHQIPLAYASTSIAFILFLVILIYHTYEFLLKNITYVRKFVESFKGLKLKPASRPDLKRSKSVSDKRIPLLSEDEGATAEQSQDFSKFRGALELLSSQSFSEGLVESPQSDSYTPRPPSSISTASSVSRHRKPTEVTYTVVDPIPSENDLAQSMTQM